MWFLLIISIINSAFDQKGIILVHRVEIAGLPINILDGVTLIGLLGALFSPFFTKHHRSYDRHPLFPVLLTLFALATAGGVFGWLRSGGENFYGFSSDMRNFTAFAIAILLGHYYLKTPDSCRRFAYVHVLGGVLSAALILLFFLGKGSEEANSKSIESIRAIQYVSGYAGLATAFLLFTLLDRKSRILPLVVALPVMLFCFVGQFATLNRSDWLACTAGVLSVVFLLPRDERFKRLFGFGILMPVLLLALMLGVYFASGLMGRDIGERLTQRVETLLPFARGDDAITRFKAWDTRLPGILRELELWTQSPLVGHGFGHSWARTYRDGEQVAFNHNVWSSALATTGVLGFGAYFVSVFGMMLIGRRMVRQSIDKGSVLMGAIAFTAGVHNAVLGATTMSFNTQRQGLMLGLLCGLLIKAREMQLATMSEYAGYVDFEDPERQFGQSFANPSETDAYEGFGRFA